MNPHIECIEMDEIEPNSGHVYEQINAERSNVKKQVKKREIWLNSFVRNLRITFIASAIVVILVFGWMLLMNCSKQKGNTQISNLTSSKLNDNRKYENSTENTAFSTLVQPIKVQFNDSTCGDWQEYQDEKCIKIVDFNFYTFDEGVESCAKLENGAATLVIINSEAEQNFISNYLFKTARKVESFWIGAKFVNSKFVWIDNTELGYTNWAERAPKNKTNYCVQMQAEEDSTGKWIDQPCEKKNLAVCQKMQTWSFARLQQTFIVSRKKLTDDLEVANKKINDQKYEFDTKIAAHIQELDNLKQNIVPIGFVYTQLPNETSPTEIWPWMNWTDVSATYAGVFFRVNGSDAAAFGQVQQDNAPRLNEVFMSDQAGLKTKQRTQSWNVGITIPRADWSKGIYTGRGGNNAVGESVMLQFKHSTGEVRPRNMAIRIWKRT